MTLFSSAKTVISGGMETSNFKSFPVVRGSVNCTTIFAKDSKLRV